MTAKAWPPFASSEADENESRRYEGDETSRSNGENRQFLGVHGVYK